MRTGALLVGPGVAFAWLICLSASLSGEAVQQAPARPTFRAMVDLIGVEVLVVDARGRPVQTLGAKDFDVRIDGRRRRVASAQYVPFVPAATPAPYDVRERRWTRRFFVVAVDETSFPPGNAAVAADAARDFIDTLHPSDYVALYRFPAAAPHLAFTSGHAAAKAALVHVAGRRDRLRGEFDLLPSEIVDITAQDRDTVMQVVARRCGSFDASCSGRVVHEARTAASLAEADVQARVTALRQLLNGLAEIPGRKTLVLISGGLLASDRAGGRPAIPSTMIDLGGDAAIGNTTLYTLHVDSSFFEPFTREPRVTAGRTASIFEPASRSGRLMAHGLERLAGSSGGAYFLVDAGTPASVFARIARENSAYYLLGVEPGSAERDGAIHYLRVNANADGATIRSRSRVLIPRGR